MRKGLSVIAAAIAAGAVTTAPAWAGASPTATTAPPRPRAGAYVGRTSQGLRLSLQVAGSRRMLSAAKFGFRVRCANHRTLRFTVSPIVAAYPWRLNVAKGTGFTHLFHDTSGERYRISGRFTGAGAVTGSLSTSWHSPHDGECTSGKLDWHATLAR